MTLPVLDWRQFSEDRTGFAAELGAACRGPGFFLLTGHTVPAPLIEDVFALADRFFGLPVAEKSKVSILNTPHFRGWGKEGDESLDETSPLVDRKETFNIGFDLPADDPRVVAGEPFRGVNQWPEIQGFAETMLAYYEAALALGVLFAATVADGVDELKAVAHFTTNAPGGQGAIRELIEMILKSQNRWSEVIESYSHA